MENIQERFKNKKILITGHTGFKGSWLTQVLLNWEAKISGISLKPGTKPNLFEAFELEKKVRNNFCDIRDFKKISEIIKKEKPEIVFHLAAQALVKNSYNNPLYTFETNIMGTANILQAIEETNTVRAAIMITTDKVYENKESGLPFKENDKLGGHDPYSASKAATEIVISSYVKSFFSLADYNKKHKTLIASVRAGNVIGGGDWGNDRLVPDLIKGVFKNETIIIRNPDAIRPWQYVLEPLYGYLLLANKLYEGKKEFSGAWNFGPHNKNYLTVEDLTKRALGLLGQGSYETRQGHDTHEAQLLKLDSNKAKTNLNWEPKLKIDETLQNTFAWYKSFYNKEDIIKLTNNQIISFFNK